MLTKDERARLERWRDAKDIGGIPAMLCAIRFLATCLLSLSDSVAALEGLAHGHKEPEAQKGPERLRCPHGWSRVHIPGPQEHEWIHWGPAGNQDDKRAFADGEYAPCGCLLTEEAALPFPTIDGDLVARAINMANMNARARKIMEGPVPRSCDEPTCVCPDCTGDRE